MSSRPAERDRVFEALTSDDPLAPRRAEARARAEAGDAEALLDYVVLSVLAADAEEVTRALRRARGARGVDAAVAAATTFAAFRAGDLARAVVAGTGQSAPTTVILRRLARAMNGGDALDDGALGQGLPPSALVAWAEAELALLAGDAARASRWLTDLRATGLLACLVEQQRARASLLGGDVERARDALSAAVWRLVRLGAPDELGRAYICMAEVEAEDTLAEGDPRDRAASWLAQAHPLVQASGTPADEARLRALFRRFGRRAIDRLVDRDLVTRIERVRHARVALRDRRAALEEARSLAGPNLELGVLERDLDVALEELEAAEEALIAALEGVVVDRERTSRLVQAARRLYALDGVREIDEALPRLVLELDGGVGAALLAIRAEAPGARASDRGQRVAVLATHGEVGLGKGLELGSLEDELHGAARTARVRFVESGDAQLALLPIVTAKRELVLLVVRRGDRGAAGAEASERSALFTSIAAAVYDRAASAAALREAAERDAAVLETIWEGILALDVEGRVRSINGAAVALLGATRDQLVGRTLDARPGLAPLAAAVLREAEDEPVTLSRVELLVRARRHPGGTVVTLRELGSAQQLAQRLVGTAARFSFEDLVGEDEGFRRVLADARRAALADVPVLITGESGTGKELLAQAIHNASPRAREPFVGINVAAIPRELLESELFGYESGAFTGARARGQAGRFELAGRGTLLLDEIGDMPIDMQAKMLRVLQERVVQRLGGARAVPIHARVLATTHRELERAVDEGTFRLDLYYRLRVVHLRLPSLRERRSDIPRLVEHHLGLYTSRAGRSPVRVAPAAMHALMAYHWPGNIRELTNLLEGAASLLPLDVDVIEDIPLRGPRVSAPPPSAPASAPPDAMVVRPLEEHEREIFAHALDVFEGNVAAAAKALGVARGTFYAKIRRFGLR
ncbi:MAG: sigma 54-interacting transcriptional regulator [Myxococcales bacterium]|nr:sigma 54-interacting transcriptional regulator [Myxococcales bacterium]